MPNRESIESDRRGLLQPHPSRPASVLSTTTQDTQDTQATISTVRPSEARRSQSTPEISTQPQPFRGFPSEDAYLDALRAWAKSKQYFESDGQMVGFYGTKTAEDYINAPGGGIRSKSKAQRRREKERRQSEQRRLPGVVETEDEANVEGDSGSVRQLTGGVNERRSSLARGLQRVFTRRGTVA